MCHIQLIMKNGRGNNEQTWVYLKRDLLSLFETATKDIRGDLQIIKKVLSNHIAHDFEKVKKGQTENRKMIGKNRELIEKIEKGQTENRKMIGKNRELIEKSINNTSNLIKLLNK